MPQLPSGRYVELSKDRLHEWARDTDFSTAIQFSTKITKIEQLTHFVDLVCYQHPESDTPSGEFADNICVENLRVSDVCTAKCNWPDNDQAWFIKWIQTQQVTTWFETLQLELHEILSDRPLPEPLEYTFDDPDNKHD